jgi:hypothetical protein
MTQPTFLTENKDIITLVGSTKFDISYEAANRLLTLEGWSVFSCGHFGHSRHSRLDQTKVNVNAKTLHFQKIFLSSAVCLIEPHYIGTSTTAELKFAESEGLALLHFELTNAALLEGKFTLVKPPDFVIGNCLAEFKNEPAFRAFTEENSLGF